MLKITTSNPEVTMVELNQVVDCVEKHMETDGVMKRTRVRPAVYARRMVIHIFRYYYFMSLVQIGRYLHRHHATIVYSLREYQNDMMMIPGLKEKFKKIAADLELDKRKNDSLTNIIQENAERR